MKKFNFWFLPMLILTLFLLPTVTTYHTEEAQSQKEQAIATYTSVEETKTIVLDAGHGGYDSGGEAFDGSLEKDITLSIALLVGEELSEAGYQVVYTRKSDDVTWPSDNLSDLKERVAISEEANAELYLSFHTNSSEYFDDGAYGIEGYVSAYNEETNQLCENILLSLEALHYTQNRGVKTTEDSSLYVIDRNSTPAILLELGFLSDSDDAEYMNSTSGQKAIASAIASTIIANV